MLIRPFFITKLSTICINKIKPSFRNTSINMLERILIQTCVSFSYIIISKIEKRNIYAYLYFLSFFLTSFPLNRFGPVVVVVFESNLVRKVMEKTDGDDQWP